MATYVFKAYVTVDDVPALYASALAHYIADATGTSTDPAVAEAAKAEGIIMLGKIEDASVDVSACIVQLLDPGSFPGAGASIEESTCEYVGDGNDPSDYITEDGREVRHDMHGFYLCTSEEAEHEDEGNASVGFDGRPHYETVTEALAAGNAACTCDAGGSAGCPIHDKAR